MGKPKTDRTQQLHTAARRYTVDEQANRAIEQHKFNRQAVWLREQRKGAGLIKSMTPKTAGLAIVIAFLEL